MLLVVEVSIAALTSVSSTLVPSIFILLEAVVRIRIAISSSLDVVYDTGPTLP